MEEEIRQQVGAFYVLKYTLKKKYLILPWPVNNLSLLMSVSVILLNNSQFSGEGVLCPFLPWQGFCLGMDK